MKEENQNKEEHFYIYGVPDRGIEVKEMLESKGVICTLEGGLYSSKDIVIYVEHDNALCINKNIEPSLCNLITSNWTELKLPYQPKDKELVWAWDGNSDCCRREVTFYDSKNDCSFSFSGNYGINGIRASYYTISSNSFSNCQTQATHIVTGKRK